MRRVLVTLIVAAIVVAVAWFLAELPGTVTARVGDTTFSAATSVVAVGLLAVFFLVYLLLLAVGLLIGLPRRIGARRAANRRRTGDGATTRALVALAAGDTADARREAARARRLLGDTPQTLLLAAEAGRLAGRMDEADAAWRQLTARPEAAFLGYRGLLRQAMEREDWVEAASLARQAEAAHPGAIWLREERARLAVRTAHWSDALALANADAPKAALATAAANAELDPAAGLRLARQAWKEDPALAPAALAYARRLREAGREGRAQGVIRQSWAVAPHPDLAAFALAPVQDKLARVQAAQRLTKSNPDHPESRLLLAATALDAGLLGEARRHLDTARESGVNQRRLWMLLARVEEEEHGDTEAGRLAQRDALRRAASAGPDPGWYCGACHTPQQEWAASCPNCGATASLRWGLVSTPIAGPLLAGEPRLPEPALRGE
ncbi:MAG TPA: heme biosynthesis HemY N-terminal domain-containing protein [Acetobacteraceae bacterium]